MKIKCVKTTLTEEECVKLGINKFDRNICKYNFTI